MLSFNINKQFIIEYLTYSDQLKTYDSYVIFQDTSFRAIFTGVRLGHMKNELVGVV